MGSCISSQRPPDKDELNTQVERHSKVEGAMIKRVAQMNSEEKLNFSQSDELVEYMKLCGGDHKNAQQDIFAEITPKDNSSLLKSIQAVFSKIQTITEKTLPTSNPNHSQFSQIADQYQSSLKNPLFDFLSSQETQLKISELQDIFKVSAKTLLVLQTLKEPDLKQDEYWWQSQSNNSELFSEIIRCKALIDSPVQQIASNYLTSLFGGINSQNKEENIPQDTINDYLPTLYNDVLDIVLSKKH